MTFEDLIEQLESDENGVAGVIEKWVKRYNDTLAKIDECLPDNPIDGTIKLINYPNLRDRQQELYYEIYGFVWGIYGAGLITADERKDLIEELLNGKK